MQRTASDAIRERENREIDQFISARVLTDDIFDKYCEEETLGEGAFGRVWRATDIDTAQEYAVKTIENADERALGREIKASSLLHEHVISLVVSNCALSTSCTSHDLLERR